MKHFFHFFSFISMVLVTMLFSSCAYFNTFYNAKQYFESAQNRALNPQGRPTSQSIEDYNRVIRKCGVILTDYKNSQWVDDALFLMARAIYYRGQNVVQALDAFNDLIEFYPDSPFVNEAILYTAKIHYDMNQKDEAFTIIRNFLANSENQKDHPKALVLISDLYILEKNFVESQRYLTTLIEQFPRSPEYAEAYILLGKTYFDNENYIQSLPIFQELTTKKVPRSTQYDAFYYIAYNYFHLQDYEEALNTIRNLQRREFRLAKLSEQSILHARIIAEMGENNEAIDMLELVVTNQPRTDIAAEAIYWIAEIQFRKLHDYEQAIENFNRVRRESQRSEFADRSVTRSAVASQILQYHRQSTSWTVEQLITEQFKLAEFYLYELALPDSALYIYSLIPEQKLGIETILDSLRVRSSEFGVRSTPPTQNEGESGERVQGIHEDISDNQSEIGTTIDISENQTDIGTTEEISDNQSEIGTKVDISENQSDIGTTEEISENQIVEGSSENDIDLESIMESIAIYENDLDLYNNIFIPQSLFMQIVVIKQFFDGEKDHQPLLNKLITEYPENRFTEAAREFLNDEPVTFLTRLEKYQLNRYEYAMSYYLQGPAVYRANLNYIINILESLINTDMSDLHDKVLYTLGFIHFVDRRDPIQAQFYIDALLESAPQSEFALYVNNFYDGTSFLAHDRLPSIVEYDLLMAENNFDPDEMVLIAAGPLENPDDNLYPLDFSYAPNPMFVLPSIVPDDIPDFTSPLVMSVLASGYDGEDFDVAEISDLPVDEIADRIEVIASSLATTATDTDFIVAAIPDLPVDEIADFPVAAIPDLPVEEIADRTEASSTTTDFLVAAILDLPDEPETIAQTPIIAQETTTPTPPSLDHPISIQYELVDQWTVKRGDTLWDIASSPEVFGNPLRWVDIYQANIDLILNPHLIFPNQTFLIPRE